MPTFRGTPLAPGVAIAAAALVTEEGGVPTLSASRRMALAARLRRFGIENPEDEDIVLIGERVSSSLLPSPLPGLRVVGVAQANDTAIPFAVPAVSDLPDDILTQTEEGDICIVDGDRGRVYICPDPETLARYQAPQRAVPRIFLEPAHIPARTKAGKTVQVLAYTMDFFDTEQAISSGADGLYLPPDNTILGTDGQMAGEQLLALRDLLRAAAGKPVFIQVPPEYIALSALGRAAAFGPLHFVLDGPERLPELEADLSGLAAEWDEDDAAFGGVLLETAPPGPECRSADWEAAVRDAVSRGVDAVVVRPDCIADTKSAIQQL